MGPAGKELGGLLPEPRNPTCDKSSQAKERGALHQHVSVSLLTGVMGVLSWRHLLRLPSPGGQ